MNSRFTKANTAGYTAGVERPSKQRAVSVRGVVGIVLTLLVPPVGLFFLWSQGVFRTRGRMLLTTLATLAMAVCFVQLTPHQELAVQRPIPAPPAAVTPAPEGENLTALYNIEELIYEQQLAQVRREQAGLSATLPEEEEEGIAVTAA